MDPGIKRTYWGNKGHNCPYCKSNKLETNHYNIVHHKNSFPQLYLSVNCVDCKEEWWEKYMMVNFFPIAKDSGNERDQLERAAEESGDQESGHYSCQTAEGSPI